MIAYYAKYTEDHHGSLDRIGGLPSHLPDADPACDCANQMQFLAQIYFQGKVIEFINSDCMAIQLYSCPDCMENRIIALSDTAKVNGDGSGRAWPKTQYWCDINWTEQTDPAPSADVGQYWRDDNILPEYEHLLNDKIGGFFPTVDHDGTTASELGIVAQLSLDLTTYITKQNEAWTFFQH